MKNLRFAEGVKDLPCTLRQRGLMMGLAFPEEGGGMAAAAALFEVGVFTVWAGNDPRVVQFLPPLVLSDDEAEDLIARVRTALG